MQEAVKNLPGPRKIGDKAFQERQAKRALRSRSNTVYGSRKGDPSGKGSAGEIPLRHDRQEFDAGDPDENPFLKANGDRVSIGALELLLEKDPGLLDVAIETEVSHADSPRKGAIEVLTSMEDGRAGGPRDSVVELLGKLG